MVSHLFIFGDTGVRDTQPGLAFVTSDCARGVHSVEAIGGMRNSPSPHPFLPAPVDEAGTRAALVMVWIPRSAGSCHCDWGAVVMVWMPLLSLKSCMDFCE